MLPSLAAVHGLVDAVAVGNVGAGARLARAHVDDVWVGIGNGDGSDGAGVDEAVGDAVPVDAAVVGLPDPAAGAAEVEDQRVLGVAGDGDGASAPVGADAAKAEGLE